jgi:aryl-alcohol dehydrogenase-like predicted oxidoreductase
MKYTHLGKTGLVVSRLCLGCMSYGSSAWRPWVLDEAEARPFFQLAVESGVNFFDTADMYSLGRSEEVTGRWLRELGRRDELVIATKVYFPMTSAPNMSGLGRKHIVQACEASLKRLGVDVIDLYQLHRFDPLTPVEETLAALDQLVRQGKVRYIGASSAWAWKFMRALGLSERNGWAKFISMQNHYNLLYREEEREMIPLCEAEGIGTIPWSPLARGRLAGRAPSATARAKSDQFGDELYNQPGDDDVVAALAAVAARRGATPAEVALAWLLGRPTVAAPIVGATKLEHLQTALRAVELQLSDDERAALEKPYRPHEVRGWL